MLTAAYTFEILTCTYVLYIQTRYMYIYILYIVYACITQVCIHTHTLLYVGLQNSADSDEKSCDMKEKCSRDHAIEQKNHVTEQKDHVTDREIM